MMSSTPQLVIFDVNETLPDRMEISPDKAMMVAVHSWDVLGASRVGLQTAFISRPGKFDYPLAPKNDYSEDDLMLLADQFIS